MKKYINIILSIALFAFFTSCGEDALEPTFDGQKEYATNVNTVDDIAVLLQGAYNRMTQTAYYGRDFIIYGEVRTDNCYANGRSGRFLTPASMNMGITDAYATDTWYQIYRVVNSANTIIDASSKELEGDPDDINHIVGQAYAIRALAHFDLLKLYGQQHVTGGTLGIPYDFSYKGENANNFPPRNTVSEVRNYIYADIEDAIDLMSAAQGSSEFLNIYGAYALQARVAIYFGDWTIARDAAEEIIGSGNYEVVPEEDFVKFWLEDGGVNSIFELAFSSTDNMNINGLQYIYRGTSYGDIRPLWNFPGLFESTDVRISSDMFGIEGSYYANFGKYPSKDYSDNIPIFRYEEVILNYAEALFELGETGLGGLSALDYLNMIPTNRGASAYGAISKANILLERRKELAFEGFRFDDLARTGSNIPYIEPTRQRFGGEVVYGDYRYAFPIPQSEINGNSSMVQNAGY